MKVLFNTYPMAFDVPGGGEMQLMAYRKYLPGCGVTPTLFDLWNPKLDEHDLVHFFSVIGGSYHFCAYVKRLGLPLVITSSLWITEDTKHLYPVGEIHDQLACADAVITNSDIESDQLASVLGLPREKFITVYNGVEEEFLVPADPALFRNSVGDKPFLLNVGNIEPRKNQLALIRALKALPDEKLILIGYIRDQAYADQCFAEGGDQVRYLGPLPHNSMLLRSAMAACRLFIIPSTLETPSLAALEAAAQGARIVITEAGSAGEYFGDLATYVNPSDVASITAGIQKGLSDPHNADAIKKLIAGRFTWPKVLPALANAYSHLLARQQ